MGIMVEDIERVRAAANIADIIQGYVALRRVGRNWVGLCPFHAEKSGSFNVREETARYRCFGCQASGDVISFVQVRESLDFVGAVEFLAAKTGISLRYDTGGEQKERGHRKTLIDVMEAAATWYHERLLTGPDGREARSYLKARGIGGDIARQFQVGWAPDDWDALSRGVGQPAPLLREVGLAFLNRRERIQDSFRGRILFPIRNENGEMVAFGGRILPGSPDPAKYKNSSETAIYAKSKTLYGLSLAKAEIVAANQVIVCEGYTDVIGFHRAGVPRAVATCGTALTEDHVRLLKRFASRVVLAFDADAAGQGAAEKFYEWEKKYDIEVSVVHLPDGMDPAELASSDPKALRAAVDTADTFLGFRLARVFRGTRLTTPEVRAKVAEQAMAVVKEHPDLNVRTIYAGQVAAHVGLPVNQLVAMAAKGGGAVRMPSARTGRPVGQRESGEVVVLALLVQRWDEIAPWLIDELFADETALGAFRSLAETEGDVTRALAIADADARDLIERIAVLDVEAEPEVEARNLIAAAARRKLDRVVRSGDLQAALEVIEVKHLMEFLEDAERGPAAADELLTWLARADGDGKS
jgi:DNA primase